MEFENNAYFWQKLDTLYLSSDLVLDKPKGTVHKRFSNLVYPVDYGYFREVTETDEEHIRVFKGSLKSTSVEAIVVCVDILKKDIEVKLLVGCSSEEELSILEFLNQTDFQKAVVLRRGSGLPDWAMSV